VVVLRDLIEDLTNTANRDVWAVRVVYTPLGGSAVSTTPSGDPLLGVFDSAHLVTVERDGNAVSDRAPMLELVNEDIAFEPQPGDKFTISEGPHAGETYTAVDTEFDAAQAVMVMCVRGDHSA
jgi:hypothetical protein